MEAATGGGEVEVTAWAGEGGRDLIRAGGVDCLVHRSVDSLVYRIIHRGLRFKPPRSQQDESSLHPVSHMVTIAGDLARW